MQTRQCVSQLTVLVIQWLSWLARHCILLVPNCCHKQSGCEPKLQHLGPHAGENVSYASTRLGRFETAPDWHVGWNALTGLLTSDANGSGPVHVKVKGKHFEHLF